MGHGFAGRDKLVYTGEVPWHNMGIHVENALNTHEAATMANLTDLVETVGLQTVDGIQVPDRFVTRYVTDPTNILGYVSGDYQVVQNLQVFSAGDALMGTGGAKVETAGSLKNGAWVWMLFRLAGEIEVVPGDTIERYLLCAGGHDGTIAVTWKPTGVRVVCQNTFMAATNAVSGRDYRFIHSGDVDAQIREGSAFLEWALGHHDRTLEQFRALARSEWNEAKMEAYFAKVWPDKYRPATDKEIEELEAAGAKVLASVYRTEGVMSDAPMEWRERAMRLVEEGAGVDIPGVRGTAWGAYNAVSEAVDHYGPKSRSAENRMLNTLFGSGDALKTKALSIATGMALN